MLECLNLWTKEELSKWSEWRLLVSTRTFYSHFKRSHIISTSWGGCEGGDTVCYRPDIVCAQYMWVVALSRLSSANTLMAERGSRAYPFRRLYLHITYNRSCFQTVILNSKNYLRLFESKEVVCTAEGIIMPKFTFTIKAITDIPLRFAWAICPSWPIKCCTVRALPTSWALLLAILPHHDPVAVLSFQFWKKN